MHLRRALLLFAIVLGMAALASALTQPRNESNDEPEQPAPRAQGTPRASAPPATAPAVRLELEVGGEPERRVLPLGREGTLHVTSARAGEVELSGLELTEAVEPRTPARFELLGERVGRYPVLFTAAAGTRVRRVGTLVVTPTPSARNRRSR